MNGQVGMMVPLKSTTLLVSNLRKELKSWDKTFWLRNRGGEMTVRATGGSKRGPRTPLQKGRYLSIEAIQAVQALKRAYSDDSDTLEGVLCNRFKRLLKLDMIAVLREVIRQNQCPLSLKVFEEIRREEWYKPQTSLYAELVRMMAANGLVEQAELLCGYLSSESNGLNPETEMDGFHVLLRTLIDNKLPRLAMEVYSLMKSLGCDPSRDTFKMLINGLTSLGEFDALATVNMDASLSYHGFVELSDAEEGNNTLLVDLEFSVHVASEIV